MAVATLELVLTGFVGVMLVSQILSLKAKVPYTLVLVFIGVGITAVSSLTSLGSNPVTNGLQDGILQMRSFYTGLADGGLFVGLVVPPLIFEAMMHIRAPDLRAVIRPSVLLATLGVLIATLVGGLTLWQLAGLSPTVSFLFAAIIAPTDVATVLEIFRRVSVPSKLATLMDTEAAFNDATGIVIFTLVLSSVGLTRVPILSGFLLFGFTTLGGAGVGFLVAFAARRVSLAVEDKMAEVILTVSAVYGSYVLASGLGTSGLIAVAVVGLYFGNVIMRTTMRQDVRDSILIFWQIAAFIGNSVAFLLIGFETDLLGLSQSIFLIFAGYLAVTVARAASVYPILALFSQVGEKIPITWSNVAMLGGVRGALSIALAASLSASALVSDSDVHVISSMVLGVAFLSITIQTPLLSRYIRRKFGNQQLLIGPVSGDGSRS
jgi:monovalent cation:H+ antiporter, CPA1 family